MTTRRKFVKNGSIGLVAIGIGSLTGNEFLTTENKMKFLKACLQGDRAVVTSLLQQQPELVHAKDDKGRSGFTLAKLNGFNNLADFLKSAGFKRDLHEFALDLDWEGFNEHIGEESVATVKRINDIHPMGGTAMWAGSRGGAGSDIWRVYAQCGDPNIFNIRHSQATSPLQVALRFEDLSTAELTAASLLGNAADPNNYGNGDKSPLHIAAERGSFEIVEMLIRLGADVNAKDSESQTSLDRAQSNSHEEVARLLKNYKQVPLTCSTSRSAYTAFGQNYEALDINEIPLFLRRRFVGQSHGNLEYVKKEIRKDPRYVHSAATTSEKCIEACAHTGRKNVVEFLLEKGAPYSLPTAVLMNDFTTVRRYLKEDPNRIHERGAHDFALLWYPVIGQCDLSMTELLLQNGAKPEEQHFMGTTALHWACMRGPIELVELLVAHGADINRIGRKFGGIPKSPLASSNDEKIIAFLKSRGARH